MTQARLDAPEQAFRAGSTAAKLGVTGTDKLWAAAGMTQIRAAMAKVLKDALSMQPP
jgi:hypothetical protein